MTAPTVNITDFCCADPGGRGCPHPTHDGPCRVLGCICPDTNPHRRDCIHMAPPAAEVTDGAA